LEIERLAAPLPEAGFILKTSADPLTAPGVDPLKCSYVRLIQPDGTMSDPVLGEDTDRLSRNPTGGYVEARDNGLNGHRWLETRWLDDELQPLGDWKTVISWTYVNNDWQLLVDQQGKALLLSWFWPPQFGGLSPPSSWTFSAQWMGPRGPVGD